MIYRGYSWKQLSSSSGRRAPGASHSSLGQNTPVCLSIASTLSTFLCVVLSNYLDRSTGTKVISKHKFYTLLHLSYFPVWECVHGAGRTVPAWIVNCPALGRRKRGRCCCCCYGDRLAGRETDKPRWTAFFSLEPVFGASYMWPNKSNCLQQELNCRNLSSLGMLPRSIQVRALPM